MDMKQRNYSLDFIKIIATILIVFHHYQQVTGAHFKNGINFFGGSFYYGYIVELFFILSGYFMYSYVQKIQSGTSFPEFYFKRFIRIFPLMTIGAIAYEVLLVGYQYIYKASWFDISPTFWGTIIASLGIQSGWASPNPCVNNPTWYISVLMLCYVVFYLIVYLSKLLRFAPQYLFVFMIFLGIGINTYSINLPFLNESSCRGYYAFFFGILLAQILEKPLKRKYTLVCCTLIAAIPVLFVYANSIMKVGINYTMTFLFYPALIAVCNSKAISRLLNRKVFGLIGKVSFDVYIWHNPFYILLYILIKVFNWNLNLNSVWTMIGYTVVCYAFGFFSYACIEMPINRFVKKRMTNRVATENAE